MKSSLGSAGCLSLAPQTLGAGPSFAACGVFSSVPGLRPPDAIGAPTPSWDTQGSPRVPWEAEVPFLLENQGSAPHQSAIFQALLSLSRLEKRFSVPGSEEMPPGRRWRGGDRDRGWKPVMAQRRAGGVGWTERGPRGLEILPKNLLVGSQSKPRMRPFLLQKYLRDHFTLPGSGVSTATLCL